MKTENRIIAPVVASIAALLAIPASAAIDYTPITAAIDVAGVSTAVLAAGALMMGIGVTVWGVKKIISFFGGR